MDLQDIKRPYDVVLSIGHWCGVAEQLKRHNLRMFSGPLDWVLSPDLTDVNRLLKNRFYGFMDPSNLILEGYSENISVGNDLVKQQTYRVKDNFYNITSFHDFPVIQNQHWTMTYPSYKEKLNFRINRFLEKISTAQSILFVRSWATYEETVELVSVLSEITKSQFHVLIINLAGGQSDVVENSWGINGVCSINIPVWNDSNFDYILNGITITNKK